MLRACSRWAVSTVERQGHSIISFLFSSLSFGKRTGLQLARLQLASPLVVPRQYTRSSWHRIFPLADRRCQMGRSSFRTRAQSRSWLLQPTWIPTQLWQSWELVSWLSFLWPYGPRTSNTLRPHPFLFFGACWCLPAWLHPWSTSIRLMDHLLGSWSNIASVDLVLMILCLSVATLQHLSTGPGMTPYGASSSRTASFHLNVFIHAWVEIRSSDHPMLSRSFDSSTCSHQIHCTLAWMPLRLSSMAVFPWAF